MLLEIFRHLSPSRPWPRFQIHYFACSSHVWRFPDTFQKEYLGPDSRSLISLAKDVFRDFQTPFLIKTLNKIPDPWLCLPRLYLEISWHLSVRDRKRWLEISKYSLGSKIEDLESWPRSWSGEGIWKSLNTASASKVKDLESCPRFWSGDPKDRPKSQNNWQSPKILGNLPNIGQTPKIWHNSQTIGQTPKNWPKSQNIGQTPKILAKVPIF